MTTTTQTIENTLFYGDCLRILTEILPPASVDLIYLDPPFNSRRDYNRNMGGSAQTTVFHDTWKWSGEQQAALDYIAARDARLREALGTLIDYVALVLGEHAGLRAYLVYMAARLLACRRALKDTGSIYLHCDPTAGHYLKLLLDAIFGAANFRNEIVWRKYGGRKNNATRKFSTQSDSIHFYVKSEAAQFQPLFEPISKEEIAKKYIYEDEDGRKYRLSWGRRYQLSGEQRRIYLDEQPGAAIGSLWVERHLQLNTSSRERRGWPTQKPLALLERIIQASSKPGDLVLDPFCGCGTAVEAAHSLGRRWIGIDVEPMAVDEMANRMRDNCGIDPAIRGIPYNFAQAERLARTAPFEFERWALRLVPGAQPNLRQTGDGGLDGRAWIDAQNERGRQPLFGFQVKGGASVGRPALDAFRGALDNNRCAAGLLIVLREATAERLRGSLAAGEQVTFGNWRGSRIGIWSVEDWFLRGEVCLAPVPPLVGAGETLGLLKARAWQRSLDLPKGGSSPLGG